MAAMVVGDLDTVVSLLHPDVTFTGDSNGKAPTAVRAVRGSDKVRSGLVSWSTSVGARARRISFGAGLRKEPAPTRRAYPGRRVRRWRQRITRDNCARRKGVRAVDIANPTSSPALR